MSTIFGELKTTPYHPSVEGRVASFQKGKAYRHPNHPPMVELRGTHYEMGLQYGVLLKEEMIKGIQAFEPVFALSAEKMGIPANYLLEGMKQQARGMSTQLPQRFLDEINGICDGSGLDPDVALAMVLSYDLSMAAGCTSVVMEDSEGRLIHGRHDDSAWTFGNAVTEMIAIVRYHPDGYHAVTQPGPILFPGIETGYNDAGLAFSEETLHPIQPDTMGGSLPYFVRGVLEEAATLAEVIEKAEIYPFIGGYGMVWSSRKEKAAILMEVAGSKKKVAVAKKPIFWNFNQYYDPELIPEEMPIKRAVGYATDREDLAGQFPKKASYGLDDMFRFLRVQKSEEGENYSWCGSRTAICNSHTQQTTIFDPQGDGFYFAVDKSHAGLAEIYHYFEDFSKEPVLAAKSVSLDSVIREDSFIENAPVSDETKLALRYELADKYPRDANMQFAVSMNAFIVGDREKMAAYAWKAHTLCPDVVEYALFAALGLTAENKAEEAWTILSPVNPNSLTAYQQILYFWIMTKGSKDVDAGALLESHLKATGLEAEYQNNILPALEKMSS